MNENRRTTRRPENSLYIHARRRPHCECRSHQGREGLSTIYKWLAARKRRTPSPARRMWNNTRAGRRRASLAAILLAFSLEKSSAARLLLPRVDLMDAELGRILGESGGRGGVVRVRRAVYAFRCSVFRGGGSVHCDAGIARGREWEHNISRGCENYSFWILVNLFGRF